MTKDRMSKQNGRNWLWAFIGYGGTLSWISLRRVHCHDAYIGPFGERVDHYRFSTANFGCAASFYGHQCHFILLLTSQEHHQAYCHSMNVNNSFIVGLGNRWSLFQIHRICFFVMTTVSGLVNRRMLHSREWPFGYNTPGGLFPTG